MAVAQSDLPLAWQHGLGDGGEQRRSSRMEPNRLSAGLTAFDANSVTLARPAPLRLDAGSSIPGPVSTASQQHIAPDRSVNTDTKP